MRSMFLAVPAIMVLAGSASAGLHGVANVLTTLDGNGDRTLDSVGFAGSGTVMTPGTISHFYDGNLQYGNKYYGWTDAAPRDMETSGNRYPGNPDRADHSSPYAGEAGKVGTLQEVFGVNNLSHIIDGEDQDAWQIELYLTPGEEVYDDGDDTTVEFALFERGWNSRVGIRGIYETDGGRAMTSAIIVTPEDEAYAGWKLNTLEIGEEQKVAGVGISLDSFGKDIGTRFLGFQLFAECDFNGPDIVAVRAQNNYVPTPGAGALLGLAGLGLGRRRR
jgi:hypothetical protein